MKVTRAAIGNLTSKSADILKSLKKKNKNIRILLKLSVFYIYIVL